MIYLVIKWTEGKPSVFGYFPERIAFRILFNLRGDYSAVLINL
jgi:hypothetical protein